MFSACAHLVKEQLELEHVRLRQECLHLQSRLCASQAECQKEREVRDMWTTLCSTRTLRSMTSWKLLLYMSQEKLLLREQLWQRGSELQRQADFCYSLGSAACGLLWSISARENAVTHWMADVSLFNFSTCKIDVECFYLHMFIVAKIYTDHKFLIQLKQLCNLLVIFTNTLNRKQHLCFWGNFIEVIVLW